MITAEKAMADQSDLAAALFCTMGASVPHSKDLEVEAQKLALSLSGREERLLKVIALCGVPCTPKQMYLVATAYSWLGSKYNKEIIHFASKYLDTDGWNELPQGTKTENGITVNRSATCRASVLISLAQAQEDQGEYEAALVNYMEAYRLEPYNAMNAVKAAELISKYRSKREALYFLHNQQSSDYYLPVKYTDTQGNRCRNDTFQQLILSHILKLERGLKATAR